MNNSRAIIVVIMVSLFFGVLVVKLFDIQILKSEELKYYAQRQQMNTEKIKAERGLIYDRNNVLMVYNRNDVSFFLDLRMVSAKEKKEIAAKFSSVFGKSSKHYLDLMSASGKTICIEKKAPGEKAILLRNYKANGLFWREDATRIYHYEKLASHVLGFVDNEYNGINGIEKSFQNELKGLDGTMLVEKNAVGDMLTVAEEETVPAEPGENIVLTINKTYQAILEEELHAGAGEFNAASAVAIIMDPNNGEILALANAGDYDPNKYWESDDDDRRNKAVTDTYEPGSTFKSITLAALLDQNLCKEDDLVFTENGKYKYKKVYIRDTHKHGYLTVKGVMEQSSNIGISKLVEKIDDDMLYKYVRGFGFGNFTSANLPGEVKGTLKKPNQWTPLTKTFMSFGYELSVTPIQMITAFSALINGGTLYQPQIIKRRIRNGVTSFENNPEQIRTVISPETSERMRRIMRSIVEHGTGTKAKLDFISVGGKTGTSQKLIDGKYSHSHHNSSFIGFFPAEDPRVICMVLMNSPQVGRYGGLVAAPVFKKVAERIVKSDPDLFGNPLFEIKNKSNEYKIAGEGRSEQVEFKNVSNITGLVKPVIKNINTMPDLKNSSVRDAILTLNKLGIKYKVNGSGRIVSQSISAGEKINKKSLCVLTCEEITVSGTTVY
ncbi:MAG: penicillin-binding transpeptidase domain-containing protein [Ignavibacteriaceae bacterium]